MKIALICFTENGFQMEKRLVKLLEAEDTVGGVTQIDVGFGEVRHAGSLPGS